MKAGSDKRAVQEFDLTPKAGGSGNGGMPSSESKAHILVP